MPRVAARFGGRQVVGAGFAITAVGFAWVGFVDGSWGYGAFVLPLVAVAVGMGLSNGPATSASTASVAAAQVGAASGVSNMARYVGAAVATALAATIYGNVIAEQTAEGESTADALSSGLASCLVDDGRVQSRRASRWPWSWGVHKVARGTLADSGAAAAAHTHTLPTSATPVA